jgi:signal transduction histidine kinase
MTHHDSASPTRPDVTISSTAFVLMTQLQDITEALAQTRSSGDVLQLLLGPILGAASSTLLLVDGAGTRFHRVEHWGLDDGAVSIWQPATLASETPAAQVLRTRTPLFFEHGGALTLAYPELEAATGATAAVASAVLPLFLDGQPFGTLVLDFSDPHHFTPEEVRFLRTLAAQAAMALGRAHVHEQLEQRVHDRTAALDAFVSFTESADAETDVTVLAHKAVALLSQLFPGCTSGFYILENGLWRLKVHSPDLYTDHALLTLINSGLAYDTPVFAAALEARAPIFVDGWDAAQGQIEHSERYQAVGTFTLTIEGEAQGVFAIGLFDRLTWNPADKAVFRAIARSLTLALERSHEARVLQAQNQDLAARTLALEAVATLAADFTLESDLVALVRRAQDIALSLLPAGVAVYYELDGEVWRVRAQVGGLGSPVLQQRVDAGLPYDTTLNLKQPWTTRQPHYQSRYDLDTDGLADVVEEIWATATLPVVVGEGVRGVFAVALFEEREWSPTDRVVLETIVRSLGLVTEGAQGLVELALKNAELDNQRAAQTVFAAFTEQVATETNVLRLAEGAFTVMDAYFTDHSSAYYELQDELWKALAWTEDMTPAQIAMIRAGLPLEVPSFAQAQQTREPVFIDGWNAAREQVPDTDVFGPACIFPLVFGGVVRGLFTVGLRIGEGWQDRDRAMMWALGRSLTLALERTEQTRQLTEQTRQLTEQRDTLDTRTRLLADANTEMEAFAYSVSHDLRTPVRHIQGFSTLLRGSLGEALDPRSARYLDTVTQAAEQMNRLIDALLDLSRRSVAPLHLAPVELTALVTSVREALVAQALGRQVAWQINALPTVIADQEALSQVLTNLMSNALKYTRLQPQAVIQIWAEDRGTAWAVLVRDNGVGFNPSYSERLFNVFQRLHHERDFEGNGVGLATVKRLILKHGGQVFAESQSTTGATFGFTLPRQPLM